MNLVPVIQNEVSQKKNKYNMLMHVYGIYKNGINEPTCRKKCEALDIENGLVNTVGEGDSRKNGESRIEEAIHATICKIDSW